MLPERSRITQIIPASDWWMISRVENEGQATRYVRTPVGAFALVEGGETERVVPLVEQDDCCLDIPTFPDGAHLLTLVFSHLAVTEQLGHCHCGRRWPHNSDTTDDIWWCEQCGGLIEKVGE